MHILVSLQHITLKFDNFIDFKALFPAMSIDFRKMVPTSLPGFFAGSEVEMVLVKSLKTRERVQMAILSGWRSAGIMDTMKNA